MIALRPAVLMACAVLSASALAQVTPSYIGSSVPFSNSAFCSRVARCAPSGMVNLASGITRSFFTVKLRKPQKYGPASYTVYLDRLGSKPKVLAAALMYPPAQDTVEDGTLFKSFISAMTGYNVNRASKDVFQCGLQIRGQSTYFTVNINSVSSSYAAEGVVTINDMGQQGAQMFDGIPANTRIVVADNCS